MKELSKHSVVPKWVRIIIPTVIIVAWFAVAGIGGPYFGKISGVATNDQSSFLPASAESTKVREKLAAFQGSNTVPAILVFDKNGKEVTAEDLAAVTKTTNGLKEIDGIASLSPPRQSDDKKARLVVANISDIGAYKTLVPKINDKLAAATLAMSSYVTGPIGFLYDLGKAFSGIDGLLLGVALAVVFVILLIVYRSPILPFVVLFVALSALTAAILLVYYLAKADVVTLNGQVQGILFILVIGAATDYSLLFVARYREELERHEYSYQAVLAAWRRAFEPIVAAGGTVIAGLLCLLLSDLSSNKALGPVGSLGIIMGVVAALTFLPSILLAFGRTVFWPRRPRYNHQLPAGSGVPKTGLWPRTARFVGKYARPIWITTTVILVVAAIGIGSLKADGVADSDLILGPSRSRDGQNVLDAHFAGGFGSPTYVITNQQRQATVVAKLDAESGVSSVSVTATGIQTGLLPVGDTPSTLPEFLRRQAKPTVVDGNVLLAATLSDSPDSEAAQSTIERIRTDLRAIDSSVLVGGTTAVQLDTNQAAIHDRNTIIPTVLIVITIILMALLRSLLAPLILLCTTVLSFAATLGVSALLFNHVFHFTGADPSVVLYGFIFLVALGIDYNIFLMTRVREESIKSGTRKGVLIGLIVTGGVITSAGIVLAATFAALAVIPILFLVQLAFIVAFGVLLDTIIVRSLLVPAFIYDLGSKSWWPAKLKN